MRILLGILLSGILLAGCQNGANDEMLTVAFIETADELFTTDVGTTSGARHLRAATNTGLVSLNAQGEIIPALADRWIVTDDGHSFIFRLREGTWSDGSELTAESVRIELRKVLRSLQGTSLGLDLSSIEEVRAMAGRVIEIRLSNPAPMLLQILAQPELALSKGEGIGDMQLEHLGTISILKMNSPAARGLPEDDGWQRHVRPIAVEAANAADAIRGFHAGDIDLVLGGRLGDWPLANTRLLSRGSVRLDPALGLFGLHVHSAEGLLASVDGREAIAMALDRPALVAQFNIGGWVPTTRVFPPGLHGDSGVVEERWAGSSIEDRRTEAARRVAAWRSRNENADAEVTISLDSGSGFDALYQQLAAQLASIGVRLRRVEQGGDADLVLVDRVARYASPRWFLNQFNCSLRRGLCNPDVDELNKDAQAAVNSDVRTQLLADAEDELILSNIYIPFGQPLRWSLVRSGIDNFVANQWAFHPLPPLAQIAK